MKILQIIYQYMRQIGEIRQYGESSLIITNRYSYVLQYVKA